MTWRQCGRQCAIFLAGILPAMALAGISLSTGKDDLPVDPYARDREEWQEQEAAPPPMPKDADLIEFFAGPNTANRFFIDQTSLNASADGVVRYVLVVKAAGGAINATFEGIRCETKEYKLYAMGRADGTWAPSRATVWRPVTNSLGNRQRAVLARDFFCPGGMTIRSAAEGADALRRGKHPAAL
ncbi:MAG: CNP1-like family protein [Zoogloeaceae bacterium]|jgi:hypothetical protein|nr:CNP1-like family protein [Zoogloeaceae bacterium]